MWNEMKWKKMCEKQKTYWLGSRVVLPFTIPEKKKLRFVKGILFFETYRRGKPSADPLRPTPSTSTVIVVWFSGIISRLLIIATLEKTNRRRRGGGGVGGKEGIRERKQRIRRIAQSGGDDCMFDMFKFCFKSAYRLSKGFLLFRLRFSVPIIIIGREQF